MWYSYALGRARFQRSTSPEVSELNTSQVALPLLLEIPLSNRSAVSLPALHASALPMSVLSKPALPAPGRSISAPDQPALPTPAVARQS